MAFCVSYPLDCGGNKAMFTMIDCMRKSVGLDYELKQSL